MKTVRQPTIKTWFVVVLLCAIPLGIAGLMQKDAPVQAAIFVTTNLSLAVALVVGIMCRSLLRVATMCGIIRSIVFFFGAAMNQSEFFHEQRWILPLMFLAFGFALPESYLQFEVLKTDGPSLEYWGKAIAISVPCSVFYGLIAVLLAKTCRLRHASPKT